MVGGGLRHHDRPLGRDDVLGHRDLHLDQFGAELLELRGGGRWPPRAASGVELFGVVVGGDADLLPGHPGVDPGHHVRHRHVDRARVATVVTGHRGHHQRGVDDVAAERSHMVERPRQRRDTDPRGAAEGRLEADGAAQRRRDADRSAGVAAERDMHDAGTYRSPRTSAGSARGAVGRPRVTSGGGRCAIGEFVGVGLADQDHPGLVQLRDGRRIGFRHVVGALRRARGGLDPGRVVEVLDSQRNTMQRSTVIAVN